MGNINMCKYATSCCDKTETPRETYSERIIEIRKGIPKNMPLISEAKPDNKFTNSSQAYDNFCLILKNVLKIQRTYRKYKNKDKSKHKTNESNSNTGSGNTINITGTTTKGSFTKKVVETVEEANNGTDSRNTNANNNTIVQEQKEKEVNRECTIQEKLSISQNSSIRNYVTIQSGTSIFSHYSSVSNSNQSLLNTTNFNQGLNAREISGNFTVKPRKGMKFKGNVKKETKQENGFGIVTWEDGSKFYSNFSNNHAKGISRFYNAANKSVFCGFYDNNIPCGYGIFNSIIHQVAFEGNWGKKELVGIGTEIWNDETYYQGEFLDSMKHGIGLYRWPDGTIYQGEWKKNSMTGFGLILFSDEKAYAGELINGKMNGYGEFTWKNGNFYAGYYENDKKSGLGVFIWTRKPLNAYIGFWTEGKQNGVGISVNGEKVKYALWKEGRRDITLQGFWEIGKYLKNDQVKYSNFLQRDISFILSAFQISY